MTVAVVIAILVAGLIGTLVAEKLERPGLEWLCKPVASTAFIYLAVMQGATETSYGWAVLVALGLSWIGDVALIAKGAGPGFLLGLVAFLLGHVAYCAAFAVRGLDLLWLALALVAVLPVVFVVARWLLPNVEAKMKRPVIAYMVVISAMATLAAGTFGASGTAAHGGTIMLAAVLFYASDLFVARQRFVSPGIGNRIIGLPLYYAGQVLFALTVAPVA